MRKKLIQILGLTSFSMSAWPAASTCPPGDTIQLNSPTHSFFNAPSFLILNTGPVANSQEECDTWTPTTASSSIKLTAGNECFGCGTPLYTGTVTINDFEILQKATSIYFGDSIHCLLGSYIYFQDLPPSKQNDKVDTCSYSFCFRDNSNGSGPCISPQGQSTITLYREGTTVSELRR